MRAFCFTVDDNVRFLMQINDERPRSIFEHPYLAMYRRLHEKYALKVQLNLFFELDGFNLSDMTDAYRDEWESCSDWLKLSFHSRLENLHPYRESGYAEVFGDCRRVHEEILRFAAPSSLAKTTTLHYCTATAHGIKAIYDNGVRGLLGLYGSTAAPRSSYQSTQADAAVIREGGTVLDGGIYYAAIDMIINVTPLCEIPDRLADLIGRDMIKLMIHEQYFYRDYVAYQQDFEEKLELSFASLTEHGYKSIFFEEALGL